MHDDIERRQNIWKLYSLVTIHTIASMMRYFIKKKTQTKPKRVCSSLAGVLCPTVTYTWRSEGRRTEIVTQWWVSTKCVARNHGSISMKVLWTGELWKGGSYPALLWWTLKTALCYFNRGVGQKSCPHLRWQVVTEPKGIWTLCVLCFEVFCFDYSYCHYPSHWHRVWYFSLRSMFLTFL